MTLRAKTLLIIGITLIGLVGLLYLVIRSLVLDGFAEMETDRIERNAQQVLSGLEDELGALRTLASDYAGWDDTYAFIADGNEAYVQSNLLDPTFRDTGVDIMIFVDRAGGIRFAKMYDAATAAERPVPSALLAVSSSFPFLIEHPDAEHTLKGLIIVDDAPLLVSSHPILRSDKTGPRRGSLIMGRWLSKGIRDRLERRLGFRIGWRPVAGAERDEVWSEALARLAGGAPVHVTPDGDRRIFATTLVRDPPGNPALLLRAERGRDLLAEGRRSLGLFLVSLVASGIVFGIATLLLLERIVLRRISRLAAAVGAIGEKGDVSARLPVHGNDEISDLTRSLNQTLTTLERSQGVLRYIGQHARAILWTATVRRDDEGSYHMQLEMQDEETAQRLLPLDIFYGGSYAHAWKRCLHPEDIERVQRTPIDALEAGKHSYGQEFRIRAKDGRDHWIQEEVDVEPSGGGMWRLVGVGTDITAHKAAEAQLQRARDAALEVASMKSDFLANMSHEIRTPMNGIAGTAELLRSTALTPEQREYLDMITSSAESLLRVINDVLDFSKIEAGRLELDEDDFQLRPAVADAVELLAVRAQQQGLEIVTDVDPDVPDALIGDAIRIRQILVNLVGNAIKFTKRGSIVVRVSPEPVDARQLYLHFSVTDTGAGIPPDKHELIFRSFAQADSSTTRTHGGTGLGLAISSQLAERMHGRMWVESEPERGSVFHFTVLVKRQSGASATSFAEPVPTLEDLPVLLVEDGAPATAALTRMLEAAGMRVEAAATVADARAAVMAAADRADPFAALIVDSTLPGDAGFTFARSIREQEGYEGEVLMMLTATNRGPDIARCRQLERTGAILKPVRTKTLREAMQQILGVGDEPEEDLLTRLERSGTPAASLRVLLAEDDAVNQRVAVRMLERAGHHVDVVGDGPAAIDAIRRERFDLVLMDVQMPTLDGFEATRRIRRAEASTDRHLPIVAMTAHAMPGDRERCIEAGMDGYVAKPVSIHALNAEIDRLLPERSRTREEPHVGQAIADAARPYDREVALARLGGDETLLDELVDLFHEEYPRQRTALRDALRTGDRPALQRVVHALRGALGNLGARGSMEAAQTLEAAAAEDDPVALREAMTQLEREMEHLMTHLIRATPESDA